MVRRRNIRSPLPGLALLLSLATTTTDAFLAVTHQQRPRPAFRRVVGNSDDDGFRTFLLLSSRGTTATTTATEAEEAGRRPPLPVREIESRYPTARGSPVDSRSIVASGRRHLTAVRVRHILLLSRDLAERCLHLLRAGEVAFAEQAAAVSACSETRGGGGELGWISVPSSDDGGGGDDERNGHLDGIFPASARKQFLCMATKPGDVVMVESSSTGYHLVQVVDVMVDVKRMAAVRKRRRRQKKTAAAGTAGWSSAGERLFGDDSTGGGPVTYKMVTMGCQMNAADSERIEGQLQGLGMRPLAEGDGETDPDVVVLNTCSIRDHAEQKVYSHIGPHAKRKRGGGDVTIVVAGCVAQQEGRALLRRAPEVDLVVGPQYANRLADLLEDVMVRGSQVVATDAAHVMEDATKPRRQSTVAAWVNAIYGCNERCAFCIVPTTRGVEQSRPVESIVREVTDLVEQGYKEVTLLGQNIDAFGRDMIPKRKFSDLLRTVGAVPGLQRLRFVTSHPRYMSMGVVDAVAETPAACESFHIPFQSGSNSVLAAMGRGHTREKYLRIVDRIRSRIPDASITADAIVGFPGETEEDFQDTLSLMEQVVFDSVNTAAYSPRPNTPAATWDNQIDDAVKQDRLQRINELNKVHASLRRSRMLGRTVEVLIEERNLKKPSQVMGRTRHGYIVYCEGDIDELRGTFVQVRIVSAHRYYLVGEIVEGSGSGRSVFSGSRSHSTAGCEQIGSPSVR